MVKLTYRVVRFPNGMYVAMAWNYHKAQIIASRPSTTYMQARADLMERCALRDCVLAHFDGEYVCKDGETFILVEEEDIAPVAF